MKGGVEHYPCVFASKLPYTLLSYMDHKTTGTYFIFCVTFSTSGCLQSGKAFGQNQSVSTALRSCSSRRYYSIWDSSLKNSEGSFFWTAAESDFFFSKDEKLTTTVPKVIKSTNGLRFTFHVAVNIWGTMHSKERIASLLPWYHCTIRYVPLPCELQIALTTFALQKAAPSPLESVTTAEIELVVWL